jgi:hypothetical protein
MIGLAVAFLVFMAVASYGQTAVPPTTKAPEPTMEEKYIASEMGRLNLLIQTFDRDMRNFQAAYPDAKVILDEAREKFFKQIQGEFAVLQKRLTEIEKKPK